ncbi:putative short transient receptor potential channel 2-like protein isoform X2 [Phyllostomus discolor]|uniref:Short transient receptor potential channel 2-like protein isoform X2 n=1 Tax=Phyllostomus discolor TaxID=89673 RepID=A0A6J2M0C0_9CHIR|nr:putative short transient receptor potential channel 2-like protein isoform X2 [Phyllostomus discolor]
MAPVKISHVVSFSSQDPKYPVENLLNPDSQKGPWLSCPQDKSGQLKVELQLERAVPIGYIDVGNCGCAFLQIDVGRSSWSLDRPFVTLLPATMLMSLTDSKQGKNRSGVRMFKDDDFLAPASSESWDRLRLTCSQPFTRHQSFGLAFLRVCSSLDSLDDPVVDPSAPVSSVPSQGSNASESDPSPWMANPSIRRTFFPEPQTSTKEISELRNILQQLQPGTLGRSARMVLSAAHRAPPATGASPKHSPAEPGPSRPDSAEPRPEEQNSENEVGKMKRQKVQARKPSSSSSSQPNRRGRAKAGQREHHRPQAPTNRVQDNGECPICAGSFSIGTLPQHAATCGETSPPQPASPSSSPPTSPSVLKFCCVALTSVPLVSRPQPNWTEIVNKKLKFPPTLLGAIQDGQLSLVQQLLESGVEAPGGGPGGSLRNVEEAEDRSWREALNLAIRLGHEAITDVLLANIKFDFRQVHEALLVAVDTNQPAVVRHLLARLEREKGRKVDTRSFSLAFFDSSIDGSRFAPGVTPLTLACQKDLYEIAQLLMDQGHTIARPHPVSCACLECSNARRYDLLKFSLSRINTYRGIASRAHLSLASEDAMLAAFQLSRELRRLARKEPEFKPEYIALESLSQDYGFELLGMCRNQSEVTAVLNDLDEDSETEPEAEGLAQAFEEGIPNLARLRLAVNYNQKRFVAHPICQQVLSSVWCGNLAGWRGSTTIWKLFVAFLIFLTMPFLCLGYWLVPKSRLGRLLKIPVLKFLLHSASYLWFLIFLLGESLVMETQLSTFRGRSQSVWETSLHMIWVTGFLWFECKEVWIEGLRSYFLDWWNFLDMVILSLYLAAFALRLLLAGLAHVHCRDAPSGAACHYFTSAERSEWRTEDPQFLAEVLFAITSMLSFTRLAYILPAHESLGTLQISIGKMIDDMIRFMFILMIILTAFLCGLNNIYVPYQETERLGNFNETFQFLFWTMFGMEEHSVVDMPQFLVPEFVGRALYGIFTIIMVIVLLNMLIAMITNSFQKIEDDADVEWKFARSKLYLSYFREGLTLPVPFNILPSPKAFFYLLRRIFQFICCCCSCCKTKKPDYPPIPTFANPGAGAGAGAGPGDGERGSYRLRVIKALVQRYIETARREFEETRRKDLGNRLTELTKTVSRLQSEVAGVQRTLAEGGTRRPPEGASILSRYITRVRNSFQNLGPPIPETPELTVPGIVGAQISSETGLQDAGGAGTPDPGEPGPPSPAHVLVHRQQDSEGAGDLPQEEDLGTREGS